MWRFISDKYSFLSKVQITKDLISGLDGFSSRVKGVSKHLASSKDDRVIFHASTEDYSQQQYIPSTLTCDRKNS